MVTADLTGLAEAGVTEVVLMNELGAHEFDLYEDTDGTSLRGTAIGTWDVVAAPRARFVDTRRGVAFSLAQTPRRCAAAASSSARASPGRVSASR